MCRYLPSLFSIVSLFCLSRMRYAVALFSLCNNFYHVKMLFYWHISSRYVEYIVSSCLSQTGSAHS